MEGIFKAFRGDPDKFEITTPMKYLLGSFGIMLAFVPVSLYVMLQDISSQMFTAFSTMLAVDLVLMVVADALIIMIWFPYRRKQDNINPYCINQCLPLQQPTDSASSVTNDMFRDVSVMELSRRLNDLNKTDEPDGAHRNGNACSVGVHKLSSSTPNNLNVDRNVDFTSQGTEEPREFGYGSRRLSLDPQRILKDLKAVENLSRVHAGDDSGAASVHQDQSEEFHRHFSEPGASQRGLWHHQTLQTERPMGFGGEHPGDASQSGGHIHSNRKKRETSLEYASVPVHQQVDGFAKEKHNQQHRSPSNQWMMGFKEKLSMISKLPTGVPRSSTRELTNWGREPTSRRLVPPEEGSRHHERTQPHICAGDAPIQEDVTQTSEHIYEMINNADNEAEVQLRTHCKADYFITRRSRRRGISSSNVDDALDLVPVSCCDPKPSSTAAWVDDDKNVLAPSKRDSGATFKRSRSAPFRQRRRRFTSPRSSSSDRRRPVPTSVEDTRPRVLHRLLATILTTGDEDTLGCQDERDKKKIDKEDVPRMEVEALPSGDYVIHLSLRLTRNEFKNFKSRGTTNTKDSDYEDTLDTLC